jgi:hypothetical protein
MGSPKKTPAPEAGAGMEEAVVPVNNHGIHEIDPIVPLHFSS